MHKSAEKNLDARVEAGHRGCWPTDKGAQIQTVVRLELVGEVVRLIRAIECGDETVAEIEAWRLPCDTLEQAVDAHEALSSKQDKFSYWSVGALAFGHEWATRATIGLIADFVDVRDEERERAALEAENESVRLEKKRTADIRISGYFREKKGRYLLELERGCVKAKPIWSIAFKGSWERDRFWDWLRWQTDRFEEFAEFMRDGSALDLERRLLREMLVTEQAVKKQGLGSGGRRPLRFWRGEL
jgi:hypothetical protein